MNIRLPDKESNVKKGETMLAHGDLRLGDLGGGHGRRQELLDPGVAAHHEPLQFWAACPHPVWIVIDFL